MNPNKILVMALIMTVGLVGSYFIIRNSSTISVPQTEENISAKQGNNSISNSPIRWAQNLFSNNQDQTKNNSSQNLSPVQSASASENSGGLNLTEFSAQSMLSKMKELDQSGKNPFSSPDPNNPENKKIVGEMMKGLRDPSTLFNRPVNEKDLKISNDNSKDAKMKYLILLRQMSTERFSVLNDNELSKKNWSADDVLRNLTNDCLGINDPSSSFSALFAEVFKNLANDYLNVEVPSDWANAHKEVINYFMSANLVYDALANCYKDPIKGKLAFDQLLPTAQGLDDIQKLLGGEMKELNL
jgi:hypothetical protein